MKKSIHAYSLTCILLAGTICGLSGCNSTKSTALNQGSVTGQTITEAADQIVAARLQVGRTTAALRNLVDRTNNVPVQYKTVTEQMAKLKADAAHVAATAESMRLKGDQYLTEWSKQLAVIQNKDLQSAGFERRGEVSSELQEIFKSYQTAKAAYLVFQADLNDIERALSSDLSEKGLAVVKPYVDKATNDAIPLGATLTELEQKFRKVGLTLKPHAL